MDISFLKSIPLWVFFILFYILVIGYSSTKPRDISFSRLFVIPLFMLLGLILKIHHIGISAQLVYYHLLPMLLGSYIGYYYLFSKPRDIDTENKILKYDGEYLLFGLLLVVFGIKFVFGYLKVTSPGFFGMYYWVENMVFGLISGIFFGRFAKSISFYYSNQKEDSRKES